MVSKQNQELRRHFLTPDYVFVVLLAVVSLLLLSEYFHWIVIFELKGVTSLIAVGSVAITMLFLIFWFIVCRFFGWFFQFSIRSLLILMIAFALSISGVAVGITQGESQRKAVKQIQELGGIVGYDFEYYVSADCLYIPDDAKPPATEWLRNMLGVDYFASVISIDLHDTEASDSDLNCLDEMRQLRFLDLSRTQITDFGLEHLKGKTQLRMLLLSETRITDAGIKYISGLNRLQKLFLDSTRISDGGLKDLYGLVQLRFLVLRHTQVTDAGVKMICKVLPNLFCSRGVWVPVK